MFIFDGDSRTITIDDAYVVNGVVTFSVQQLWSRWVDWNAATSGIYPRAFDIVMVPLGGGAYVGPYLFMRNDLGWRVIPPAVNPCTIIIEGSFYGKDPLLPVMNNLEAQATDMIVNRSSITNTISTEGGSGTAPTANEVAAATLALFVSNPAFRQAMTEDIWSNTDRTLTESLSSGLTVDEHSKLMAVPTALENALAHANRVVENNLTNDDLVKLKASILLGKVSGAGSGIESFRDLTDVKDRIVANVDINGNRTSIVLDP